MADIGTTALANLPDLLAGPVGVAFSLTLLGALAAGKLRGMARRKDLQERRASPPSLPRELLLPVVHRDPDHIARAEIIDEVSRRILDGDWETLTARIAEWEARLEATPGGTRFHDIAVETCLAGLQNLIDETERKSVEALASAELAVERFVDRHRRKPDDHILAVMAARAHMIVAETCSADYWPESERTAAWRRMAHHYLRAEAVLTAFDPVAYMSPLLGGTIYTLALGMPDGGARLRPAFEDWIDLDPSDPAIYGTHAANLLPDRFGAEGELEAEALRAERRTRETLGKGGYALMAMPAIETAPDLRDRFEPALLAAGLMDLARLSGTQAEVNWAAACLARESEHGPDDRRAIMDSAFEALVRRNLGVIYPRLWNLPLETIRARLRAVFDAELPKAAAPMPEFESGAPRAEAA